MKPGWWSLVVVVVSSSLSEHAACKGWDKKVRCRVEPWSTSWTDIINIATPNIASYRGHKPANLTPV